MLRNVQLRACIYIYTYMRVCSRGTPLHICKLTWWLHSQTSIYFTFSLTIKPSIALFRRVLIKLTSKYSTDNFYDTTNILYFIYKCAKHIQRLLLINCLRMCDFSPLGPRQSVRLLATFSLQKKKKIISRCFFTCERLRRREQTYWNSTLTQS